LTFQPSYLPITCFFLCRLKSSRRINQLSICTIFHFLLLTVISLVILSVHHYLGRFECSFYLVASQWDLLTLDITNPAHYTTPEKYTLLLKFLCTVLLFLSFSLSSFLIKYPSNSFHSNFELVNNICMYL